MGWYLATDNRSCQGLGTKKKPERESNEVVSRILEVFYLINIPGRSDENLSFRNKKPEMAD
jgi:hypothetical protein